MERESAIMRNTFWKVYCNLKSANCQEVQLKLTILCNIFTEKNFL